MRRCGGDMSAKIRLDSGQETETVSCSKRRQATSTQMSRTVLSSYTPVSCPPLVSLLTLHYPHHTRHATTRTEADGRLWIAVA